MSARVVNPVEMGIDFGAADLDQEGAASAGQTCESSSGHRPMRVLRWAVQFPIIALLGLLASCARSNPTIYAIADEINATLHVGSVVLAPGDEVTVTFPTRPEWSHSAFVNDDGTASFSFLEVLSVAGMTLSRLKATLEGKYTERPDIMPAQDATPTVSIARTAPRTVAIAGEVSSPGLVLIEDRHLTVLEALALAGGHDKGSALLKDTTLVRWMPEEGIQRVWHFDARRRHWKDGNSVKLQAHDVLFVPNNGVDRVNVWVDKYIRQNIPIPNFLPVR